MVPAPHFSRGVRAIQLILMKSREKRQHAFNAKWGPKTNDGFYLDFMIKVDYLSGFRLIKYY